PARPAGGEGGPGLGGAGTEDRRQGVGQQPGIEGAAVEVHVHEVGEDARVDVGAAAQVHVRHAARLDQPPRLGVRLLVPVGALGREDDEAERRGVLARGAQQALERDQRARLARPSRVRELLGEGGGLLGAENDATTRATRWPGGQKSGLSMKYHVVTYE